MYARDTPQTFYKYINIAKMKNCTFRTALIRHKQTGAHGNRYTHCFPAEEGFDIITSKGRQGPILKKPYIIMLQGAIINLRTMKRQKTLFHLNDKRSPVTMASVRPKFVLFLLMSSDNGETFLLLKQPPTIFSCDPADVV